MTDLVIITPSRERPHRLERLYNETMRTTSLNTSIVACVDDDDPRLPDYAALEACCSKLTVLRGPRRSLSAWTNDAVQRVLSGGFGDPPRYFASLGDDHVPDTPAWDSRCATAIDALGGSLGGWAWGPDGIRRDMLPTWWVMSAAVVRRLGWMMLPSCEHMYVDNATKVIAEQSERACWLPDVLVRHEHPVDYRHRDKMDDSYRQSNQPDQYARDAQAFRRWCEGPGLRDDVAKLIRE
jgi:hypothetical protein